MKTNLKRARRTTVTLGAMLLLAATATGCGVGLPTQPVVDEAAGTSRMASSMTALDREDPVELGDGSLTSSGRLAPDVPAGETVVPTPTGNRTGNGLAKGHYKDRKKPR